MAEMNDMQEWAAGQAGPDDGAVPEPRSEEEPLVPADVYQHAAEEIQEAIDAMEKLPDDGDTDWRNERLEALTSEAEALQNKADELSGEGEEEDGEEEDGEGEGEPGEETTPEPEGV